LEWSERISNKRYLFGTIVALGLAVWGAQGDVYATLLLCGAVLASVANQWLMFSILGRAFRHMTQGSQAKSMRSPLFMLQVVVKLFGMGAFFFLLAEKGRTVLFQGVVLYTFQLIILVWSIKNRSAFFKKGPPP
jgi:predicted membrane channel-forming protein YqfA (hemolysin III family)